MPDQGVRVCFVDTPGPLTGSGQSESGGTQIELVEPLPGNTSIAGFLEKNPAGGQHHMCYEVPDIQAAKAAFEALRSEEHTSELQSLMRISYAVFCLIKKKTRTH